MAEVYLYLSSITTEYLKFNCQPEHQTVRIGDRAEVVCEVRGGPRLELKYPRWWIHAEVSHQNNLRDHEQLLHVVFLRARNELDGKEHCIRALTLYLEEVRCFVVKVLGESVTSY